MVNRTSLKKREKKFKSVYDVTGSLFVKKRILKKHLLKIIDFKPFSPNSDFSGLTISHTVSKNQRISQLLESQISLSSNFQGEDGSFYAGVILC